MSDARAEFLAMFKPLNAPFGYEESCKLAEGRMLDDRCLASFGRNAFGATDQTVLACLSGLLNEAKAPAAAKAWLATHHAKADVIHFGFEAEGGTRIHKIYLEYVGAARAALALPNGPDAPVLVHRALKWRVGTDHAQETAYRLLPAEGRSLSERLAPPAGEAPQAANYMRDVLALALTRVPAQDLILLDVADAGSARHSHDLQLYDAGLRLADVEAKTAAFGRQLGISAEAMAAFFTSRAATVLGHVAGGQDAAGRPFATLYFGVQPQ